VSAIGRRFGLGGVLGRNVDEQMQLFPGIFASETQTGWLSYSAIVGMGMAVEKFGRDDVEELK
jgi:hypothetical protein